MKNGSNKKISPLPEGIYRAKLFKTEDTKSKNGRPILKLTWEIGSGKHAGSNAISYIVLDTDNTDGLMKLIVSCMGYDPLKTKIRDMVGEECNIEIEHQHMNYGTLVNVNRFYSKNLQIKDE